MCVSTKSINGCDYCKRQLDSVMAAADSLELVQARCCPRSLKVVVLKHYPAFDVPADTW